MAIPPGPRAPMPVQTARFIGRPVPYMEDCRRRYGETFTLKLPGVGPSVFISDPESMKSLFAADRVNTIASRRNLVLAPLVGTRSLLLLEGSEHLGRRKLMLPPFHGDRMRAYERTMVEAAEREIARWPSGEEFPLHPAMQAITLDVIMRAVFGVTEGRRDDLRRGLLGILGATRSPLAFGLTVPVIRELGRFGRIRRQIDETDEILYSEIRERRGDPGLEGRDDILSMLVAARDAEGEGMDDRELRDQLMTLLLAGHETTATALAWAFDLLFRRPDALARLRAEIAGDEHEFLDAVIEETLRVRPVVPFVGRDLKQPMTLAGWDLPVDTTVMASIYLAHTNRSTFPEPYAFRPERYLDGSPETYSWVPFGGGTRRCIGAAFAQLEMRAVLRTVLRAAELRPATAEPEPIVRRNVTLSPRDGTRAVMTRRLAGGVPVAA